MESWGLVFLDAMLCGCPVIGTPESLDEMLESDREGFRVKSSAPDVLAGAIHEGLSRAWDRDLIRRMACRYDWSNKIGEFEELYQSMRNEGVYAA